jgi:hypothetical protein
LIQGCHSTYLASDYEERRLINQAIFARLLIRGDSLDGGGSARIRAHPPHKPVERSRPRQAAPKRPRPPSFWGPWFKRRSIGAPEWTRTTTGREAHKALNLARLPNSATGAGGRV